jgi:uncharacterized protein YggT (Ycf19 family)
LNAKLNPICHLLALFGAHHIFHISRIRVGSRIFLELFKRISRVSVRNQTVALQLLYSVCEPLLSIIYRLVYELIQGIFFIAALLTAE